MKRGNNINRSEFIQQLVDEYNYTKKSATTLVDDFLGMLTKNIEMGNEVSFHGFGKFSIIERKGRLGTNPRTGERCQVPEHWVTRFYPGTDLKVAVRKWIASRDGGDV